MEVYYYRFELCNGDLSSAKATFTNIWPALGYSEPPAVATLAEAMALVVHPDDQPGASRDIQAALSGETPDFQSKYRVLHADGSVHWNVARGIVTRDANGTPLELSGTSVDITELQQAQEESRRHRERLELAIVGSKIAVWDAELDPVDFLESRVNYTNVAEMLGYDPASFPQTWREAMFLYHEDDRDALVTDLRALLIGTQTKWEAPVRVRHRSGDILEFLFRGVITRDVSGRAIRFTGSSIEVTDRNRLAAELARAKERLELAVVGSKTATWDFEVSSEDVASSLSHYVNVAEILGYPELSNRWGDGLFAFHEDDRERLISSTMELFASDRREWEDQLRMYHQDGTVMWFFMRGVVTRDAEGKAKRFTGISIEVTERKHLAEELEATRHRLELGLRSSGLGLFDIRFATATQPARRMVVNVFEPLGYPSGSGDEAAEGLLYDEDRPMLQEHLRAYLAGEVDRYELEHRHRHRDGSERWKLARGVAIRDENGQPTQLIGCLIDITERKRMEKELRAAEERFRSTFHNAAVGMAITDAQATFVECNEMLYRLYGYSPQELATLRFPDLSVDPAHRERDQFFAVVDGTLDSFKVDKRYRRKDGHIVWGNATVSAVHRDENGRATEMLTVIQDITERKTLELELQAAREAAEAANRAKDQFLAHVSHEIRTPLNAILGMTELALDSDGEHQRQLLRTARSAAGSLLEIVNDLLDFSKIEAGKLSLDVGNFSLRTLLADLVRGILPRTEAKSLSLEYVVADEVPDVLVGDEHRLRQILSNLLANAIKFTPKGSIELQVRAIEVAQHAILAFEVVDTGIGIAPDKQDAIFRAFEQADTTTTRKYGGTGLGLTISAQLAELMGGRIEVSSEVGRGSTFTLTVPFALGVGVSAEPRVDASVVLRTAPPRILVAEDNEMNVAVVREILQKRPHHADYADNGRTALELATRGDYDLLLLDLHMPELDGFEVVRAIRGTPRDRHLPIIALTARSSQKDREEALAAGMDDFLSKPVDVKGLWAGIDRMLAIYPPLERPLDLLDREVIARVSGGRADVLARLVTVFRSTLPGQLARGHVAFDERDFVRLRDAAHRLHGTLGAFSSVAGAVALALEDACARGETHRCRDLLGELDHMSGELLESTLHLSSTP